MKFVTAAEMQEIDRRAIQEYGIPSVVLMENAGIVCAGEILRQLPPDRKRVAIFCGKGNNGGDGFVIARQLTNKDCDVHVFYFEKPEKLKPDPKTNFQILEKMKLNLIDCANGIDPVRTKNILNQKELVVDALFGTGLSKPVEEPFKTAIQLINDFQKTIISVDMPSGLHSDNGEVLGVAVQARCTITFGLPKKAFQTKTAGRYTGKIMVANISIPKILLES